MEIDPQVEAFLRPFSSPDAMPEAQPLEEARASYRELFGGAAPRSPPLTRRVLAREFGNARIAAQFLLYPLLDLRGDSDYPSRREFGDGRYFLGQDGIDWSRDNYLARAAQQYDPLASPLAETDLQNLPPTLIMTASHDPLRDEGQAYAVALQEAGVPTVYHCVDGAIHGFLSFAGKLATGRQGLVWLCEQIKTALA